MAREMLELAESGTLQGLAFVAKLGPRDHRAGIVGAYTERPEEAVYAAAKMKKELLEES